MPRPALSDPNDAGQDSFLDVVSNIVGILIILVMVVGGRVRHLAITAATEPVADASRLEREIEELTATVASTESEIDDLQSQARTVASAAAFAGDARLALTTALSAARVGLAEMREQFDARQIAAAAAVARRQRLEAELADVGRELEAARQAPAAAQQVLAYPTPIGRTVNGEEIHFRITGDRIAYIPLEELFGLAKQRTQRHSGSVATLQSRIESVGPEQGFTLDYVIEAKIDQARGQVLVRSREWVVRPAAAVVGETVEEALAPGSRFRAILATVRPETTVTLWCYPDGFASYRRVREELHRLDVPTAGRPLPDGAPIGGSTEGSKSVVQ